MENNKQYNLTQTEDNGESVTTTTTTTEHASEILRMMKLAGIESAHVHGHDESIEEEVEAEVYEPTEANDKLDLDDYSKKSPESISKQKKSIQPTLGDNPLEYSLDENEIYEAMMTEFNAMQEVNEDESVWNQFQKLNDEMDGESEDTIFFSMKHWPKHRFQLHGDIDGKDTKSGGVHLGIFVSRKDGDDDNFAGNMSMSQDEIKANITGAAWVGKSGSGELKGLAGDYTDHDDIHPEPYDDKEPEDQHKNIHAFSKDASGEYHNKDEEETEELEEAQSPAQKAAFAKMLAAKNGKKDEAVEETTEEKVEETDELTEETISEDCGCGHGSDCDCSSDCDCGCNAVEESVSIQDAVNESQERLRNLINW